MNRPLRFPMLDPIAHNYLPAQFADMDAIWTKIRAVVERGDFTLGRELGELEEQWAAYVGTSHAVGVNSGTDALILIMKALGIKGEVIVPAFTFFASAAAVHHAGARPVLCDVGADFNIDPDKIEALITPHTEAILPVHWAGRPCNMRAINAIARNHGLVVIEDACHAIGSTYRGVKCGALGNAAAFSLHPLKNVNVWGDGGVITTNDGNLSNRLRKWRNHGLVDRNTCEFFAHNSRLDTIQAVVAGHALNKLDDIVIRRRSNAALLDSLLPIVPQISWVTIDHHSHMTYYLYSIHAQHREDLLAHLNAHDIDAKAHYPVPLHLQPACSYLGYKAGDFPGAEMCSATTISLPVHEFVSSQDCERMAATIKSFYA